MTERAHHGRRVVAHRLVDYEVALVAAFLALVLALLIASTNAR